MAGELLVAKPAQKDLAKLPPRDRERVRAVLRAMSEYPFIRLPAAALGSFDTLPWRMISVWFHRRFDG